MAESATDIVDVRLVDLNVIGDARGSFTELFRPEWFPEVCWDQVQCNRSLSTKGVLRGLHFHLRQVDFWICLKGRIKIGLYDLRRSSPSRGTGLTFDMSAEGATGLLIPEGVAHGYAALTDATIHYVVNRYYDNLDEFGVAWDDPDLELDWSSDDLDLAELIVTERDATNPRLSELKEAPE